MSRRKPNLTFEDCYCPEPFSGCWLWQTGTTSGYGAFAPIANKSVRAHRYSWERVNGAIPKGMDVLHKCDVKLCVNPAHLMLGNDRDNMCDFFSRGRLSKRIRLTPDIVRTIRLSAIPTRELSKSLAVDASTINRVRRGATWRYIS